MGDFDRNPSSSGDKPNETKKLIAVISLGAVLIGVVAWQFTKKNGEGPQAAAGAPVPTGVALPAVVVPDEMSPEALMRMQAELQNDPTRTLLQPNAHDDHTLDVPPRNPFAMNPRWLGSLIKTTRVAVDPPKPVVPSVGPAPVPTVSVLAPRAQDYKLNAIYDNQAIISTGTVTKAYRAGDLVGKARVVSVLNDRVILRSDDAPSDGPTLELSMNPSLSTGN